MGAIIAIGGVFLLLVVGKRRNPVVDARIEGAASRAIAWANSRGGLSTSSQGLSGGMPGNPLAYGGELTATAAAAVGGGTCKVLGVNDEQALKLCEAGGYANPITLNVAAGEYVYNKVKGWF